MEEDGVFRRASLLAPFQVHLPANGRFSPTSLYVLIHVLNVGQMGRDHCEELKEVAND